MNTRTAMLLMTAVLGGACDPDEAARQSVEAAAKTLEAVENAKATKKADFATCMSACAGAQDREPDDAATCRLNCEAVAGEAPAPSETSVGEAVLLRFDSCANSCADRSSSDRATCRLNCAETAPRGVADVVVDAVQRGCGTSCLHGLVTCDADCPGPAADASTCRLHCETDVTRCLSRCAPAPPPAAAPG